MKSSGIGFIWYILVFLLVFMLLINFIRISTGADPVKSMSLINTLQDLDFSANSFRNLFQQNLVIEPVEFPKFGVPNYTEKWSSAFSDLMATITQPINSIVLFISDIIKIIRTFFALLFGYAL